MIFFTLRGIGDVGIIIRIKIHLKKKLSISVFMVYLKSEF